MFKVPALQQVYNPSDDQMRVSGSGPLLFRTLPEVVSRDCGAGCEDVRSGAFAGVEVGGNMGGAVFGTVLAGRGWGHVAHKGQSWMPVSSRRRYIHDG